MNLSNPTSSLFSLFCPYPMQRRHYLSIMLLKSRAFSFENELRIFIVGKDIKFEKSLLKLSCCDYRKTKVITKVRLEPYFPKPKVSGYDHSIYEKINRIDSDEYVRLLTDVLDCEADQSRLYEKNDHIDSLA